MPLANVPRITRLLANEVVCVRRIGSVPGGGGWPMVMLAEVLVVLVLMVVISHGPVPVVCFAGGDFVAVRGEIALQEEDDHHAECGG
jgi:hypothetical protein